MALDLRDLLKAEMRVHPRVGQQALSARPGESTRIAAALPPLVPFGGATYAGASWVADWDHKLPSRQMVLRLYAWYSSERQQQFNQAFEARREAMRAEDLFP